MKGIYIVTVFCAVTLAVIADEFPDDEIPTSCPPIDPMDRTIHLKHESDCTKFYKCAFGEKILQSCPWMNKEKTKRLHFNAKEQVCDWPCSAGCITCPTYKTPDYDQWNECPPKGSNIKKLLPHECNCINYYECIEGDMYKRKCPMGYHFDYKEEVCSLGKVVQCERPIPGYNNLD